MSARRDRPRRRRGGLPAAALTLLLVTPAYPAASTISPEPVAPDPSTSSSVPQTSDRVPGEIARPLTPAQRAQRRVVASEGWTVAPGVEFSRWDEVDARGPVRLHLLTVELDRPEVSLDYLSSATVPETAPVLRQVREERNAVAGINGDFFDISDTGAPLGIGVDRQDGLRNARKGGWNNAFFLTRKHQPRLGKQRLVARIAQHPRWKIHHLNSPTVKPDRIGIYTRAWGLTAGDQVTDGQRRDVRTVVVRRGRVVSNRARLSRGETIRGTVLVGRGRGAQQLAGLRVGSTATVRWWLPGAPRVAITGNAFLLRDGEIKVTDDVEMHPRTAIGIDTDTGNLLLLVVDGRQEHSRGLTMLELAERLRELGAEDALNLDGGGSSTVVGRRSADDDRLGVLNDPSDGRQRKVPNGLVVRYRP